MFTAAFSRPLTRTSPAPYHFGWLRTSSLIWLCTLLTSPPSTYPPRFNWFRARDQNQRRLYTAYSGISPATTMRPKRTTAGLIIIGDEILNGSTNDTNSHFLCARLHKRGVLVKKVGLLILLSMRPGLKFSIFIETSMENKHTKEPIKNSIFVIYTRLFQD